MRFSWTTALEVALGVLIGGAVLHLLFGRRKKDEQSGFLGFGESDEYDETE